MQAENKEKWGKTYYVYNDEILDLVKLWRNAPQNEKIKFQDRIISRMGYIIYKRIAFYKNNVIYEDLKQEARIGILTAIEKFDPNRCVNFFHYSIWHIRSRVRMYLNKNKRKMKEMLVEDANYMDEEIIDPILLFEEKEGKKVLISAINDLPEIDRQVIKMHYGITEDGEHKTYKQIGDVFSLSKQRIEQINSRAVLRLRKNSKLKEFFDME